MKHYKSQADAVLVHLQEKGHITSMEAFKLYGVTRLSAIIFNLRKLGYIILSENRLGKTRYGNTSHFAEYIYKGEK